MLWQEAYQRARLQKPAELALYSRSLAPAFRAQLFGRARQAHQMMGIPALSLCLLLRTEIILHIFFLHGITSILCFEPLGLSG